ncbi:MAG: glycosyltransferase family 4 protein, partial [Deltaproteobacteria bacterium]|nr:glycosyltransferase family 4 protein [Deltaproteobacteria bacterium]
EVSLNVPDHKRFILKENSKDTKIALGNFKLVYHGTITKRLGVDLAIQAVAKLMCKIPGLEFHIYGIGDDVVEFKELSKSLKVDHAVFINRGVPIESIVSILDGMDLGIIANRKNIATELMLPVKMLEYIALNIPVIAPRLKTIQYYFTDEMVNFFEPGIIDDMARAILELYNDKSKRVKQVQMARKFIEKYGWEHHQMDLVNFYNKL